MKLRTIITQDAEVDDQNSLRHFMFYANEVDLKGIIQTSSTMHWEGVTGAVRPAVQQKAEMFEEKGGDYDKPYRWPGTDWMYKVAYDYEQDYPNLSRHALGYPTPEYVRSIIKVGNIGYAAEMEKPSAGSELIRKEILADDDRKLYIQVWGGTNTICRALMDIQSEYENKPGWEQMHKEISDKIVITACGEQDSTYRTYLGEEWPDILFVRTLQMGSYAYPWRSMPEGESHDTFCPEFMKNEILTGKSALSNGYSVWMDGHRYIGEAAKDQFGAYPNAKNEWFGAMFGLPTPQPYDFLSEGDSPTYFLLLDWGFRTLENFSYGGIAGRYHKVLDAVNSKGQPQNKWDVCQDVYVDRYGNASLQESMWRYTADIQRDFAARIAWAATPDYDLGEHKPVLKITEGLDLAAAAGESIALHAQAACPDGLDTAVTFRVYEDASAECAKKAVLTADGPKATLTIPADAASGDQIHVVVCAQASGHFKLTHYQQIIVTVK